MISILKKEWRVYVMYSPKFILLIGVVLGLWLLLTVPFYWGCGILIATGAFFKICLRRIPFRPPHVGIVVVWDKRLPIIMTEGLHFFAPFFPFNYTVTTIKVEKTNVDITYPDIRCKARAPEQTKNDVPFAGGEVSISISYTYYPDYKPDCKPDCKPDHKDDKSIKRLFAFINCGGHQGVQKILKDIIEEDVRQIASHKTWEEISFAGEEIRNALVKKITGEELKDPEAIEKLSKDGFPDVADLGIRICRFNIGRVKEQGELANAAEAFAKEVQNIRGKEAKMKFIYEWIKKLKGLGGISGDVAVAIIQVAQKEATKHIERFEGLNTPAQLVGAIAGKFLQEEKQETKQKGEKESKEENKKSNKKK